MRLCQAVCCVGFATGVAPHALAAQEQSVLPARAATELPGASPRATGFVGRILSVTRGETVFGDEQEAEVGIGEDFPLFSIAGGVHPVTLEFGVQVYGRFSLDDPTSTLISNDWVVGFNTVADLGRVLLSLRLYHESSHLGDEYIRQTQRDRLDWSREVAALWVAYRAGQWTFHANLSLTLQDQLEQDRPAAAIAIDWKGNPLGLLGLTVRPVGGVYSDAAAATSWKTTTAARLGLALPSGHRQIAVSIIALDGLSTQRQFFQARSQYVGMEFRFDL